MNRGDAERSITDVPHLRVTAVGHPAGVKQMRLVTFSALVLAAFSTVSAQQDAQVTYVPADKVAAAFAQGGRFAAGPDYSASVLRRTAAGQSEVHVKEVDIFYVVDGEATFVTGGTMVGGKETRPNQLLGTGIDGGQVHQLKKGDVIVIPAGVPHWFKEVPKSINYYTVKVIKP
jgi:mannose-6-phosphate isomerase-like protein (cupin superfamily)